MRLQLKRHIADLPNAFLGIGMAKPNEPTRLHSGVSPRNTSTDHRRLVRLPRVFERDTVRESSGNAKGVDGLRLPCGTLHSEIPLASCRRPPAIHRVTIPREKGGPSRILGSGHPEFSQVRESTEATQVPRKCGGPA